MGSRRKLKNLRTLLGLTQQEVASWAGFSKQAYSFLEQGRMAARPERMVPINKLLRARREHMIDLFESQIEILRSFDIDESLYLIEQPIKAIGIEAKAGD